MRKCLLVVLLFSFQLFFAQEAAVQKTIETFFEGFHQQDSIKIGSVCDPRMRLQSVSEQRSVNKLTTDTYSEFIQSIIAIPETVLFEETIVSYDIKIDGAMAHVWTPYEFYINGKLSHRGVNSFQLFRENESSDTWKIIYIVDTRRK